MLVTVESEPCHAGPWRDRRSAYATTPYKRAKNDVHLRQPRHLRKLVAELLIIPVWKQQLCEHVISSPLYRLKKKTERYEWAALKRERRNNRQGTTLNPVPCYMTLL